MANSKEYLYANQQSVGRYVAENMSRSRNYHGTIFRHEEDGNIVTLTAEQQHVINRWNAMSDEKRKVFSALLDMLSDENT